jgi:ATP synthase F1 delta subunit
VENLTVNDVYGEALYEAAADLGKTDEFVAAVRMIADSFKKQPEFFLLLRMPSISPRERKEIAAKVFAGRVPQELLNFLYVLMDKRRVGSFEGVARAFEKKANAAEGVMQGTIESAVELTKDRIARFEEETGKLLRGNVKLEAIVNPNLIGGVRIYINGKLIDASVRSKLDDLRDKIMSR